MIIIGLTGTNGSGKDELSKYLETKGFAHFSARKDILEKELMKKGLALSRENMISIANEMRAKDIGALSKKLFDMAIAKGQNAIIESLRSPAEIDAVRAYAKEKKISFVFWGIDANPRTRYDRTMKRKASTDPQMTFEQFVLLEQQETQSKNPKDSNIKKALDMASEVFFNNGTLESLYKEIELELRQYL